MDILDILEGRFDKTFTGRYYKKLPSASTAKTGESFFYFDYQMVDPYSYQYVKLIGNIVATDAANLTVKTKSSEISRQSVGKHVALQDGRLYLITSVTEDFRTASAEAARLIVVPTGADKIIRLKEVDDPFGIGGLIE